MILALQASHGVLDEKRPSRLTLLLGLSVWTLKILQYRVALMCIGANARSLLFEHSFALALLGSSGALVASSLRYKGLSFLLSIAGVIASLCSLIIVCSKNFHQIAACPLPQLVRLNVAAAFCLALSALLLVRDRNKKPYLFEEVCASVGGAGSLYTCIHIFYSGDTLQLAGKTSQLNIFSVFACFGLFVIWCSERRKARLLRVYLERDISSSRARNIFLAVSGGAFILGFAHLLLLRHRYVSENGGRVWLTSLFLATLCYILRREAQWITIQTTEQQKAVCELEKASASWTQLLEQMPDAFFVLTTSWRVTFVNKASTYIFESYVKSGQVVGRTMMELFPGWENSIFRENYQRAIEKRQAVNFVTDHQPGDRWFWVLAYPIDGHLSICFREVTDNVRLNRSLEDRSEKLKQKAQQLARSNTELQNFAHVISHDLQEPLRDITRFGELLTQDAAHTLEPPAQKYLKQMMAGTQRMQQLIGDLLTFSEIRADAREQSKDVRLEDVILRIREDMEATLRDSQGQILVEGTLPVIKGSFAQFQQLFQNLCSNALKFRREHCLPQVILSSKTNSDGSKLVTVKDNGIGIAEKHLDRVFAVFQRLHSREEYPGTGIGLAICKRIVSQTGGQIWAESQEGQGTTFHMLWQEGACVLPAYHLRRSSREAC